MPGRRFKQAGANGLMACKPRSRPSRTSTVVFIPVEPTSLHVSVLAIRLGYLLQIVSSRGPELWHFSLIRAALLLPLPGSIWDELDHLQRKALTSHDNSR